MTGATSPNPDVINPVANIAYQDEYGFYRAGEASSLTTGKSISKAQYNQLRHLRQVSNATKSAMREIYQERGYDFWSDVPQSERADIEAQARKQRQDAFEKLDEIYDRDDLSIEEKRRRAKEIRRDAFDS